MSHHAAKALARQVIEIASHVMKESNDGSQSSTLFNMHDGIMYTLPPEQQNALRKLSQDLIVKSKATKKISEKYAFETTRKIFAGVISADQPSEHDTSVEIAAAMKTMEQYEVEQTVYLRVRGLRLGQPLKLGNVEFVMCSAEVAKKHIAEIYEKIDYPLHSGDQRLSDRFSEYFSYNCLAITKVVAEPLKAFERAHDETRRSLEILRFACVQTNFGRNVKFGLDGDLSLVDSFAFVSSQESATGDFSPEGNILPYFIDASGLANLDKIGALKLADFLLDPNLSKFKESLLRAVHWLSSAITQTERENKYLHLVIALEALFTAPKGEPISNTIAESSALVINNTLSGRLQIKTLVKKCYDTRSTIAHGGKSPITDNELGQLTIIVLNVIRALIDKTDDFQNQQDLRAHLENLKFT
ncbi:hypothetical protein BLX41_14540 [Pseudomonas protegens]|uniref:HEPN domain-containing protein n=1 Tax=Pseudomonas protegens TaxID=380021 RepID=UPI000F4CCFEB|nr:HEPN domain-containing protein [Pseudomonas protegens]ROL76566.1 hypothetical protein BLX41_14540 [Pseudomonas protegens]